VYPDTRGLFQSTATTSCCTSTCPTNDLPDLRQHPGHGRYAGGRGS